MSDELFRQQIQFINRQMAILHSCMMQLTPALQKQVSEVLEETAAALGNLQLICEEVQTSWEASAVVESELFQENQQAMQERQYYYNLFQFSPDAYLLIDANGVILSANEAVAKLLNVPQIYLPGKPLTIYITQSDRSCFRTLLNQLSFVSDVQNWEMNLCPRHGKPFAALLKVAVARDDSGFIGALRIGVHDINQYKQVVTQLAQMPDRQDIPAQATTPLTQLHKLLTAYRFSWLTTKPMPANLLELF